MLDWLGRVRINLCVLAVVGCIASFRHAWTAFRYPGGKPAETSVDAMSAGSVHPGDFVHIRGSEWLKPPGELTITSSESISSEQVFEYRLLLDPLDAAVDADARMQAIAERARKIRVPPDNAALTPEEWKSLGERAVELEQLAKQASHLQEAARPSRYVVLALDRGSRDKDPFPDHEFPSFSSSELREMLASDQTKALHAVRRLRDAIGGVTAAFRPGADFTGMVQALPDEARTGLASGIGFAGPALQLVPGQRPNPRARLIFLASAAAFLGLVIPWGKLRSRDERASVM